MPEERRRITVEIITDSPQIRARLRQVIAAAHGIELFEESAAAAGLPDVVLLDPSPGGDASSAVAPPADASSRTLLLTEHLSEEWVRELLGTRAAGVVSLEATPEEITAAIEAVVAGLIVFSPELLNSALPQSSPPRSVSAASQREALTPRETDVLRMLADGLSNKEVALQLRISEHTVKYHLSSIFGKLGVSSRTEAVMVGIQRGVIMI